MAQEPASILNLRARHTAAFQRRDWVGMQSISGQIAREWERIRVREARKAAKKA